MLLLELGADDIEAAAPGHGDGFEVVDVNAAYTNRDGGDLVVEGGRLGPATQQAGGALPALVIKAAAVCAAPGSGLECAEG